MADLEFSKKLLSAVDQKTEYYNSQIMPKMFDQYRLLHSCVKSIFDTLVEKSLIKPDPYKLEKKISDIVAPCADEFTENERALTIGSRFSDYEAMLDFICNYYKMSVETLSITQLKKLADFNQSFLWNNLSESCNRVNTRGLAFLAMEAKRNMQSMAANQFQDTLHKCAKATTEINNIIKELSEFQKEAYKAQIRRNIFEHPKFDKAKASESPSDELTQIKKLYPHVMSQVPYYGALVDEIIREDFEANRQKIQEQVIAKLGIPETVEKKKVIRIDPKDELMKAILTLSSLGPQLETIHQKITDNHQVLQNENNSFMQKFLDALRKAFNLNEASVIYQISIKDKETSDAHKERLEFHPFAADIAKKAAFYNSFALKSSNAYQKIESSSAEKILDFLNKNISESQKIFTYLSGLDEFFKTAPQPENRHKIKGIKMELTTMKNSIVNTNQHRAEYLAFVEEQAQMQKLGIKINE